jgi:hypothetical protein
MNNLELCSISRADDRVRICFQGTAALHDTILARLLDQGYVSYSAMRKPNDDEGFQYIFTTMPEAALIELLLLCFETVEDMSPSESSLDFDPWMG